MFAVRTMQCSTMLISFYMNGIGEEILPDLSNGPKIIRGVS